jgi:methionyl-tRNA synthetase
VDALRYFVMREMVVGQDANFADETFLTRYNADLANDLGNVVSRVATMIVRYCDGVVPKRTPGSETALDAELQGRAAATIESTLAEAARFDFSAGLRSVWELIAAVNKYIVTREPWSLAKSPSSRGVLDATLYNAADALRVVAALVDPVMPESAGRIRRMLGSPVDNWLDLRPGTLRPGTKLGSIEPLFPRMEQTVDELRAMSDGGSKISEAETAKSGTPSTGGAPGAAPTPAPQAGGSDKITIDDFMKVDLRVARVLSAEKVPNSRKLVKLSIDVGTELRTLVAGIAEAYEPESLVGRTIVMVFNLKPAKLMGIESNGMVLAASAEGGKPILVGFDQDVPLGTKVR